MTSKCSDEAGCKRNCWKTSLPDIAPPLVQAWMERENEQYSHQIYKITDLGELIHTIRWLQAVHPRGFAGPCSPAALPLHCQAACRDRWGE